MLTATTVRGSLPPLAFSICWPRCTPTRQRGAARRERDEIPLEPPASNAPVRAHDLHGVWFPESAPPARSPEVYCVVAAAVSAVWHRHRLGNVPFFAVRIRRNQATQKHSFLQN